MRMKDGDEFYQFWGVNVNVTSLREYAIQAKLPIDGITITSIAKMFGFEDVGKGMGRVPIFHIDPDHAMSLPESALREPGLVVEIGESKILVDGTHRAYRLWLAKAELFPAFCIKDRAIIQEHSQFPDSVFEAAEHGSETD